MSQTSRTTPPPPEDPVVTALSRIEGTLDELKALMVAQAQQMAHLSSIATKCFDECFVAHQSQEEIAKQIGALTRRVEQVERGTGT